MRTLTKDAPQRVGESIILMGWVSVRRDHGKLIFIDLRDKWGVIQVVFTPADKELLKKADQLRPEWVVKIEGKIKERPEGMKNTELETGGIEMEATGLEILNEAQTPPFALDTDGYEIGEEHRFEYRYLDLRRPRMQRNLQRRAQAIKHIRDFLTEKGFTEIETPVLTKTTPEGARDFVVPSRLHPGNFYALPQSPQQYKQLLMVAGFERYFQIARCFRDEDARADRAYGEFVQLDLEMSFIEQEDVLQLTEELFSTMVQVVFPEKHITQTPWPRLTHEQAMAQHQTDKPDLRADKNDPHELAFAWTLDFPLFTEQSKEDFFHGSGNAAFAPSHHMFTSPHPDDVALLESDPARVRGMQHDLVLNGFEVGGGSMRIHNPKIQTKVFDLIGFSDEQKQEFSHMLEAFTYGVPPHGGIAPGIDRLLMAILGEPSLREVAAFPKTGDGRDLMMHAPSQLVPEQLEELHIQIEKEE